VLAALSDIPTLHDGSPSGSSHARIWLRMLHSASAACISVAQSSCHQPDCAPSTTACKYTTGRRGNNVDSVCLHPALLPAEFVDTNEGQPIMVAYWRAVGNHSGESFLGSPAATGKAVRMAGSLVFKPYRQGERWCKQALMACIQSIASLDPSPGCDAHQLPSQGSTALPSAAAGAPGTDAVQSALHATAQVFSLRCCCCVCHGRKPCFSLPR
jgi:hypothetical protein